MCTILDGTPILESRRNALGVIPDDVRVNRLHQRLGIGKGGMAEHLLFQMAKEALDDGMIQTGRLARHGGDRPGPGEEGLPRGMLVVQPLIGVHDGRLAGFQRDQRVSEHAVRQLDGG